jgi:iron complex transport system substrate-binding protein
MDKKIVAALIVIVALITVIATYSYSSSIPGTGNTTITDMTGRSVHVPGEINKVLTVSPPTTNLVYMLAPDKLGGWNFNLTDNEKEYMPSKYQSLPIIGGWFSTYQGNPETFIAQSPDVILDDVNVMGNSSPTLDTMQNKMGSISVVGLNSSTNVTNYAPSIKFVGKLLGVEDQANKLINFYDNMTTTVNSTVSNISEGDKVTVYYAEGTSGLQTDPNGSAHSQLITFCGGINVANVALKQGNGMSDVSMEQVLVWNPEVIITNNPQFYSSVYSNSSWQDVTAVQNKRVYLAPTVPEGWFDRPPGVNTIIGIPWTAKVLYPDKFQNLNMTSLTEEFYSEFYHVNLTDSDVKNILSNETFNNTQTYNT